MPKKEPKVVTCKKCGTSRQYPASHKGSTDECPVCAGIIPSHPVGARVEKSEEASE